MALPLALASWFLILAWAVTVRDHPTAAREGAQAALKLLIAFLALLSALSSIHVVLRGARHWTLVIAFVLSVGLLGSWGILILLVPLWLGTA
jgi:hypothetical protein